MIAVAKYEWWSFIKVPTASLTGKKFWYFALLDGHLRELVAHGVASLCMATPSLQPSEKIGEGAPSPIFSEGREARS